MGVSGSQWKIGPITLSGAWAPTNIKYTEKRVQKDIMVMDRAAVLVDMGVGVPELNLEGVLYGEFNGTKAEDAISAMQSYTWNHVSATVDIPRTFPTRYGVSGWSDDAAPYAIADLKISEEGGAVKVFHWEMKLRRLDQVQIIQGGGKL